MLYLKNEDFALSSNHSITQSFIPSKERGRRGCGRMVYWYAISAYRHLSCELESHSWRGVLDTTLCDTVCQWLAAGRWFSYGTPVSSTNETDRHDTTQ